jgi:urea transport system permease protein
MMSRMRPLQLRLNQRFHRSAPLWVFYRFFDLALDGLSLASIYFLAAIGLAITFGVMGVINMAHGEFIMMGAYTGYVVQQFIPNHTVSIAGVALPLAFVVTFMAPGVRWSGW